MSHNKYIIRFIPNKKINSYELEIYFQQSIQFIIFFHIDKFYHLILLLVSFNQRNFYLIF